MNTMNTKKTKDVSVVLSVSQTTIKRWASQFPADFQKDHLGHYIFSDHQISQLLYIKDQIERGNTLDLIKLPVRAVADPVQKKPVTAIPPVDDTKLLSRIREVERSLEQKADEVVSAQVLQHRAELDELRQMVAQLAATVETMQGKGLKPTAQREEFRLPVADKASVPARKRGFFRTFF